MDMLNNESLMKKTIIKKIILPVLLVGIVAQPLRTQAVWGMGDIVSDFGVIPQEVAQTIGQVTQIVDMVQNTLKTFGLDVVIYKVSQKMSQKLLNKVLNKANGGASGDDSKLFVENFGKYFEDISNQQIGAFTNSLQSSNNPFAQSIITGISDQVGGFTSSGLNAFSLDKALPDGIQWQDAARDISNAGSKGWDFYGSLAMPQNSPLGSSILAQDELAKKIQAAKQTAQTELSSSGFKPDKEKSGINSFLQNSGMESFGNVNTDGNIKTPSNTTEEQSKQSVNESFDRLRNADTFGKIIFNTITQMVTGLIQKGFSNLRSDGGGTQKAYGGPRDLNSILSSNQSWANAPQQVVDLRGELDTAIEKTRIEIKSMEETIDSIKKPITDGSTFNNGYITVAGTILSLEACIPGPDTGFEQRLTDYVTEQTKGTQNRGSDGDSEKGEKNSDAYIRVRSHVDQAMIESKNLVSNPFLNIPASTAMKSALSDYYKSAKQFRGLIDILIVKRQTLTNLQVIQAEAQALGTAANNGNELVLNDLQWNKLTQAQKNQLYTTLTPEIINDFPEYLVEESDVNALTVNNQGPVTLSPLPANDPNTPENERDIEMKKRIFDHQWNKWESIVADKDKQPLYARYIAMSRDISDSASAQRSQLMAESTQSQYDELLRVLSDCKAIRAHLAANPNASSNDPTFVETLQSSRIKAAYSGPSILNAVASGIDFNKLNERVVGSNSDAGGLQVPQLAQNAAQVFEQDQDDSLFCRLMNDELFYWAPPKLTGKPIGCGQLRPKFLKIAASGSWTFTGNDLIGIHAPGGDSGSTSAHDVKPSWYRTNNAEILFSVIGE